MGKTTAKRKRRNKLQKNVQNTRRNTSTDTHIFTISMLVLVVSLFAYSFNVPVINVLGSIHADSWLSSGSSNLVTGAVTGMPVGGIGVMAEADLNASWNISMQDNYYAWFVANDSDGNIYVAGEGIDVFEDGTQNDIFIRKWNSNTTEDLNFNITFSFDDNDNEASIYDRLAGMVVDKDNNIFVGGTRNSSEGNLTQAWIKKFNSTGHENVSHWNKTFMDAQTGLTMNAIAIDSTGRVVVGGDIDPGTGPSGYIRLFSANGTYNDSDEWIHNFTNDRAITALDFDSNDVLFAAGFNTSAGNDESWRLFKIDPNGTRVWNVTSDNAIGDDKAERPNALAIDSADFVYVVGFVNYSSTGNYDWMIKQYESDGTEDVSNWNLTFDLGDNAEARSIAIDANDKTYILGKQGTGFSATYLLKQFADDGTEDTSNWNLSIAGTRSDALQGGVTVDSANRVYVATAIGFTGNGTLLGYEGEAAGGGGAGLTLSEIIITAPANSTNQSNDFVINVSVGNATNVTYRWENSTTNGSWSTMTNLTLTDWNATFEIAIITDGTYVFRMNVTNGTDTNTTKTVDVTLDATSPTTNISFPERKDTLVSLSVNTTETGSGIDFCFFTQNTTSNLTLSSGYYIGNVTNLTGNTQYNVNVTCQDYAGNSQLNSTNVTTSPSAVNATATTEAGGSGGSATASSTTTEAPVETEETDSEDAVAAQTTDVATKESDSVKEDTQTKETISEEADQKGAISSFVQSIAGLAFFDTVKTSVSTNTAAWSGGFAGLIVLIVVTIVLIRHRGSSKNKTKTKRKGKTSKIKSTIKNTSEI